MRKRAYLTTHQAFFEIKIKNNKGKTRKRRIEVPDGNNLLLCKAEKQFLKKHTPLSPKNILPVMRNEFTRITLVHNSRPERVTLDFKLRFQTNNNQTTLPFLSIVEIKQEASTGISDIEKILRSMGIQSMKFSKYCMGSVFLDKTLKYNRFKTKLITINKLRNDSIASELYC